MQKISRLAEDFFEYVLYDEQPLFVSDEAKIWDVSTASPEELIARCRLHYKRDYPVKT